MEYRRVGQSGLEVSVLSLGSWITFGKSLDLPAVKRCLHLAFDHGVNFFDNAEVYAHGASELLMGEALREFSRESLVVSTKIFWGGEGPNRTGLSYKHLVEGVKNSLRRLQLDYVDLLFCHRKDPLTPVEESLRAIDHLVREGLVLYWGTSEWEYKDIEEAFSVAKELGVQPPIVEQPEYNLLHRRRVEQEYLPLFATRGLGATIWSPLASGVLTGKYNNSVPTGTRLHTEKWLKERLTREVLEKTQAFCQLASAWHLDPTQLALAWCLKNPHVSSVIMGVSSEEQIQHNIKSLQIEIAEELLEGLEEIFPKPLLVKI